MLQSGAGGGGQLGEEQLSQWLAQLQQLSRSGDGDTVLALYGHLQRSQPGIRLGDVYSALVSLRDINIGADALGLGVGAAALPPGHVMQLGQLAPGQDDSADASHVQGTSGLDVCTSRGGTGDQQQQPGGQQRTVTTQEGAAKQGASGLGSSAAIYSSSCSSTGLPACHQPGLRGRRTASPLAMAGLSLPLAAPMAATGPRLPANGGRGGAAEAATPAAGPSTSGTSTAGDALPGSPGASPGGPQTATDACSPDLDSNLDQLVEPGSPSAEMSPGLLAFLGGSGSAEGGSSDVAGSAACSDQAPGAASPSALLAFKDQLLAARLRLDRGSWRLSPPGRRLLAALVRYRDALLPLATAGGGGAAPPGAAYMCGRCCAALALLRAEPRLGHRAAALVLEDLRLSAALAGLPGLDVRGG
jgi:hypothetical protein